VVYSADGKRLASCCTANATVKLWDAVDGKELAAYRGHTAGLNGVAFSPDGQRLASASLDKTVKVWDISREQEHLTIDPDPKTLDQLAFHPDGKHFVTLGKIITIWHVGTGKPVRTFANSPDDTHIQDGVFSPDGQHLAVFDSQPFGQDRPKIRIWDPAIGKPVTYCPVGDKGTRVLYSRSNSVLLFSADGRCLFAHGQNTGQVSIWDVASGTRTSLGAGKADPVSCLALSPDGRLLAVGRASFSNGRGRKKVELWDLTAGEMVRAFADRQEEVKGGFFTITASPTMVFSRDGKLLLAAEADRATVWNPVTGAELSAFRLTSSQQAVVISPDGQRLASLGQDGTVALWDMTSGQQVLSLKGFSNSLVSSLKFSPDGRRLAQIGNSVESRPEIRIWDATPLPRAVKAN
jgi:WD40 repeat protein